MKKYSIAVAGTTERTALCAQELIKSNKFDLVWILTPSPKPVGRKKEIKPNSLDSFAKQNEIYTIYIDKKIDGQARDKIEKEVQPDFLLVVDFGYLVPSWLLKLPKVAPLNIHPSELPRWRGSSPGQFSILYNDTSSAISLMVINEKLDQGPIIHQDFFKVEKLWNQSDYYKHAFKLMCFELDQKISKFAENKSVAKKQPKKSPTITARTLKKSQTFIEWNLVKQAMGKSKATNQKPKSSLLSQALEHNRSLPLTLERASKAFYPWPSLWTMIPTKKGEKRMKLLELELEKDKKSEQDLLILKTVQVEGKNPCPWAEIKNIVA